MDMDTDWCLTCNRRVDGSNLYCSLDCQYGAGPSTSHHYSLEEPYSSYDDQLDEDQVYEEEEYDDACGGDDDNNNNDDDDLDDLQCTHNIEAVSKTNWAGRGSAGIRAWAAEIPLGAHPHLPPATAPSSSDDSSSISSASSTSSTHRAPNLVRPSRPLPPSLTMSKPEPPSATPPRPILSLQKQLSALSNSHSPGSTTRTSILSEDSLPTPGSINAMPFSALPRRPFPSISDARAYELAACTKSIPPHHVATRKDDNKYVIRRSKPISPRVASSAQSSLDDELVSSPPWWATNTMVARQATRAAAKKPVCSSNTRMVSEAVRGRRSSRAAA